MIITRLAGGLGNQLFQYALGRYLAELNGTILKLDVSRLEIFQPRWYNKYKISLFYKNPLWYHNYCLKPFNINGYFLSSEERKMVSRLIAHRENIFYSIIKNNTSKIIYIVEKEPFVFNSEILKLPDNTCLFGHWQNEKYFIGIKDIIQNEFRIREPQKGKNLELSKLISSCESVSIHIRYGYNETDSAGLYLNCINSDYYQKSIEYIVKNIENPHFFIFSDNPKWARENFKIHFPCTFVGHNDRFNSHEDFRLMSQCNHNIIANSTFSWWGAWLNQNKDKIVIAPKKWFTNEQSYNIKELIPISWIKM